MSEFTKTFSEGVTKGLRWLGPAELPADERMPKLAAYALVAATLGLSGSGMQHGLWLPILIPMPKVLSTNIQLAFNTVAADLEDKAAALAKAPARLRRFVANHL